MALRENGVVSWLLEGRIVRMDASVFEKMVRGAAIDAYNLHEEILMEASEQGAAEVIKDSAQP